MKNEQTTNSIAQHTPGPWELSEANFKDGDGTYKRIEQTFFGGDIVGLVCVKHELNQSLNECGEANARLIAAAPELLDSLQKLCAVQETGSVSSWAAEWYEARAAIAKATGGAA